MVLVAAAAPPLVYSPEVGLRAAGPWGCDDPTKAGRFAKHKGKRFACGSKSVPVYGALDVAISQERDCVARIYCEGGMLPSDLSLTHFHSL